MAEASSDADKAIAYYELALFHDNNNREAEAIPHYEAALTAGLVGAVCAECLAWLASSLYKTDRGVEALRRIGEARGATEDESLRRFLDGLERRVRRMHPRLQPGA